MGSKGIISLVALLCFLLAGCRGPKAEVREHVIPRVTVTERAFRDSLSAAIGRPFLASNKVTQLVNGVRILPPMIDAIRSATNYVHMENFIWKSGRMSDAFIDALTGRARAGVQVRIVVDALGSLEFDDRDQERLRESGVVLHRFNKPRIHLLHRLNKRDHRKLLIVDGHVAFTGGACVGDAWLGNAETKEVWRDTHFMVEGPVVAHIEGTFGNGWLKTEGELLFGERYFPEPRAAGNSIVQAFNSDDGDEPARLVYLSAIAAAQKSIKLSHSYFVPDDLAVRALVRAAKKGVSVEVITPGSIDANVVRRASRALLPDLLKAGVKVYEYGPAMLHTKIMIVDEIFVTSGSVNFDPRSFRINDESNINVIDPEFSAVVIAQFERDRAQSTVITEADLKKKPLHIRAFEKVAALFRPQL